MKRLFLLAIIANLGIVNGCGQPGEPVRLLGGENLCTIVLDLGPYKTVQEAAASVDRVNWYDDDFNDDAISTHAFAALELRTYLSLMTGIAANEIPIVDDDSPAPGAILFLGLPAANEKYNHLRKLVRKRWKRVKSKGRQGFRLDTFVDDNGSYVVLSSRAPVGVLYAAYELLDRLGVRRFGPGDAGEHIPDLPEIVVPPLKEYIEPAMEIRGFWLEPIKSTISDSEAQTHRSFYQWMSRNRMNYFRGEDSQATQLKQRGMILYCGGYSETISLLSPDAPYPYRHSRFKTKANNRPPDPYPVSDEFRGDADGNGKLSYGEAHPEWYAMRNGKRLADAKGEVSLCLSNQDALVELSKNLVRNLEGAWKAADVFEFWPFDIAPPCQCPSCQALGNDTDKVLHAVYIIRQQLEKAHKRGELNRTVRVFSRAFRWTLATPTQPLPKDFDAANTAMVLFPENRCYNHALWDTLCTEVNLEIARDMDKWFGQDNPYTGKIYLCESYNSPRFRDLPVVFTSIMKKDIPDYYRKGVRGMYYLQPRQADLGVQTLLNYQFARLLWNPAADVDSLTNEFFQLYYAGVADLMQEYYSDIEKAMANIMAWRGELVQRIREYARGELQQPILPLQKYRQHFYFEEHLSRKNDGTDWANTLQLIHEARFLLDQAMERPVSDVVMNRLLDDEYQLHYAELTVRLYDYVIRLLTLEEDEPEMREEASLRLRDIAAQLEKFQIRSPAYGVVNGLEASDIKNEVRYLLDKSRQNSAKKYRRVYQ